MTPIAPNLWIQQFELSMLGGHQGRVVTVIRLGSGKLIIHSTAAFTPQDVATIHSLGTPAWILDAMINHDTFTKEGVAAFPNIPFLAPAGFKLEGVQFTPLLPAPAEWSDEVRVLQIAGMPTVNEHVILHIPSRTLIVADLAFNFAPSTGWTSFFRRVLMGVKTSPDSARLYPRLLKDRPAYDASTRELFSWDFDRIITGHKEVVPTDGKAALRQALANKGMLPDRA